MDPCSRALRQLRRKDSETFVKALDAFGKVPPGVMDGNFLWLGDYDECITLPGLKYCSVNVQVNASTMDPPAILQLNYGVCVPEVCTPELIIRKVDSIISITPLSPYLGLVSPMFGDSPVNCQEFPQRPYDTGFICFTVFCSILLLLMILGTATSIFQKNKRRHKQTNQNGAIPNNTVDGDNRDSGLSVDEERSLLLHRDKGDESSTEQIKPQPDSKLNVFQQILMCFAFNRNLSKLLDTRQQSDRSTIQCLNGIRVISLTWIILGHTYTFNLLAGTENPLYLFDVIKTFTFQAIANAYSAVDTFFFMSGFLISYLTLSRMETSRGKLSLIQFYFHRIWRLTPLYAFVILFMIYYYPYFGSGPVWYKSLYNSELCAKYWWRNLLFINNFFPVEEMCLDWSWYLSNEMQFYIISPLILIPLYRTRAFGIAILSFMLLASLVVTGVLISYYHLTASPYGVLFGMDPGVQIGAIGSSYNTVSYLSVVYFMPYCRIAPYLVGIFIGYFVYKQKSENRRIRLSEITVVVGWVLALAVGLAVVYGTYGSYGDEPFESIWSMTENIMYGTFYRLAWSMALAWVLFACHYGYGGWISTFLSWSFWIPISRLTYSAYLIHGIVAMIYFTGAPTASHISLMTSSYIFCGTLLISYAAAALFSLAVEYPLTGLEKIITGRNTTETNKRSAKIEA